VRQVQPAHGARIAKEFVMSVEDFASLDAYPPL
jgi:hypothetical protein